MCIAVMVPTCSYAARKETKKIHKRIYNYLQQIQTSITKFSGYWPKI